MVSGKTKSPRSQIRRGFSPTWDYPAISPRHSFTRADTSTNPLFPYHTPPQMSPQKLHLQLLLQAFGVETNLGAAPRYGVCRKSTTAKAVICCTCQKTIHRRCSGINRTMQTQCCQTKDYQCPNCRSVPYSQNLCCKCGKGFRLNHSRATCGVCDATAHLECRALSRRERESLKKC